MTELAGSARTPGRDALEPAVTDRAHVPEEEPASHHERRPQPEGRRRAWRGYLRALGPGLITGSSDDDPSGIATYAQVGAKYGFGLLWLTLVTFPLMSAVQEICDRTALATGDGLGELISRRFAGRARWVIALLLVALVTANTLNIAADLVAIGAGMNLLHAGPTTLWAVLAGLGITALVVAGSFSTVTKVCKALCVALLAYLGVLFAVKVPWLVVARRLVVPQGVPGRQGVSLVVAVLGTTISPYLFFWQSANRVEELREAPEGGDVSLPLDALPTKRARRRQRTSRMDVFSGMLFSQLVMFAIIVSTAVTLHAHGHTDVASAAEAAKALEPVAGQASSLLFAIGFVGSGVLAVPVLAGSGSAGIAGLTGRDWGYSRRPGEAPVFYGIVALGTLGGAALTLLHVNPISLLVVTAVVNGIAAAPCLTVVMLVAGDRSLMGEHRNGRLAAVLGWATVALMAAAALAMVS